MDSSSFTALFSAFVVLIIIVIAVLFWPGIQKSMEESRKRREAEKAERQRQHQEFVDNIEKGILPLLGQDEIEFGTYDGEYVFMKNRCWLEMDVMVTDMVGGSYEVTEKATAGALHAEPHLEQRQVDSGDLYYTNYRWVFLGQHKTYSITNDEVVRREWTDYSFMIAKQGEDSNLYFMMDNADNMRLVRNYVATHPEWTPEFMQAQLEEEEESKKKTQVVAESPPIAEVTEAGQVEAPTQDEPTRKADREPEVTFLEKVEKIKAKIDKLIDVRNSTEIKYVIDPSTDMPKIKNKHFIRTQRDDALALGKKARSLDPPDEAAKDIKRNLRSLIAIFADESNSSLKVDPRLTKGDVKGFEKQKFEKGIGSSQLRHAENECRIALEKYLK